jgi:transcriptional regulatory protein LevR
MPFEERFRLLIESGQASEQSIAATRVALDKVEAHYEIQLSEGLGASLASHLGITLKRLLAGEALTPMPDVVWQEIQDYPEEIELAESIVAEMKGILNIAIARDEVGFIAVHLCKIRSESAS